MKNKIAIASAFLAASSFSTAEIVVNDFLSFEGFIDMSYTHTDSELDGTSESTNNYAIDQVEISWLFDFDPVTAQIDLQYEDMANSTDFEEDIEGNVVEQAFATYHFDNGGAITAGRYASMLGFEAFEPTGLYQYSFSYDIHDADGDFGDLTIIPGYAQGIKFTYETENTFFGISLQDEAFDLDGDRLGGDDDGIEDASSYAVEAAFALNMDNGLSWFLGGVFEAGDDADDSSNDGNTYVINSYVTFETGAWIFAAEANYGESETERFALEGTDEEVIQALIMANFAYSDQASVTGRISYADHEDDDSGAEADFVKYTLAHGYAFTDNLFLVNEISYVDGELDNEDYESLLLAVELIFSF